jgi:hypothetical protein
MDKNAVNLVTVAELCFLTRVEKSWEKYVGLKNEGYFRESL